MELNKRGYWFRQEKSGIVTKFSPIGWRGVSVLIGLNLTIVVAVIALYDATYAASRGITGGRLTGTILLALFVGSLFYVWRYRLYRPE